jgi:hypothetical protein
MAASNEQLAVRFVELLSDTALRNGQRVPGWRALSLTWQRIWAATITAFLDALGYRAMAGGRIEERDEDEQIRRFCENLTARQRLKTYRQLYALGCRIDGIERSIEKLTAARV